MKQHIPTPSRHVDLHGVAICECGSLVTDRIHQPPDQADAQREHRRRTGDDE